MSYLPNTADDRSRMLEAIGVASIDDLFAPIPAAIRAKADFSELEPALDDIALRKRLVALSSASANLDDNACFLGAGIYDHYIPPVVGAVCGRSEFYTAYTPYQPEVSQGVLQSIYEFQSLICRLTGMDVANASMYDGATALAEAVIMAADLSKRRVIVLPSNLHPSARQVVETYLEPLDLRIRTIAADPATGRLEGISLTNEDACLVVQQPNFHGVVEDLRSLADTAHAAGALLVASVDPISLGLLETPGAAGADIVVAEGQGLGCFPAFGGPLLGIFACRKEFVRRIPGRIVGGTIDNHGRRAYTMTLRTREQDIRRDTATSNICTNQALFALAATVYLATMGRQGLGRVAELCLRKASYLKQALAAAGCPAVHAAPTFKEFVIRCPDDPVAINRRLLDEKIIGGLPLPELGNAMLVCVTEQRTREEIDRFARIMAEGA
ncbi:MAG: aminomethyl-transferring glycine dehydrogenase subunit GcvPA [Armatimonadota bacterium]